MSEPLASKVIQNARVEAFKHPHVDAPPRGFRGGPVLSDSELDSRLRHTRKRRAIDHFDEAAMFPERLSGHYAYGGGIYHHFGHVMAEMIHRILPVQELEINPRWLFVTSERNPTSFDKLAPWVDDLYRFLGVDFSRATIVNTNVAVDSLLVVQAGSDLGGGAHEAYFDILDETIASRIDRAVGDVSRPSKIYISRAGSNMQGCFLGERYLESLLAEEGFTLVRPEEHRFAEQLDFYRKADVVIFPEGSACHGAELLGRRAMRRSVLLPRRGTYHLGLFEGILTPRSQQFSAFPFNQYLGTASVRANGTPEEERGVTLFDFETLVQEFRNRGLAHLRTASRNDYLDVAEADLSRYLQQKAAQGRLDDLNQVKELLIAFGAARAT
jgi:hypothetical protein